MESSVPIDIVGDTMLGVVHGLVQNIPEYLFANNVFSKKIRGQQYVFFAVIKDELYII